MDAGVYECTADNMYSIDRRSFKTDFSIAFDWLFNMLLQISNHNINISLIIVRLLPFVFSICTKYNC